jgi:hypothetical protein
MNAPEHLKEHVWERPDSYYGHNPVGDYVIYTRHRDSTIMENVNFEIALERLEAIEKKYEETLTDEQQVYDFSTNHCAVGWVEYLIVPQCAPEEVIQEAAKIICSLADYHCLDDDKYTEKQQESILEFWQRCSLADRVEWCQDAGASIFAARRDDDIPVEVDNCMNQHEMFY